MAPPALPPPPELFRLAAEPIRWALLRELARSDRQVEELVAAVDRPQNLVSYHLGKLRDAGLVAGRRSSHDARDVYYHLDVRRCDGLFATAASTLHPALTLGRADGKDREWPGSVLFLCTENSARSQMAEALLRHVSGGAVHALSAGSHPSSVHPEAVRAMRERGVDMESARAKHVSEVATSGLDLVVTVCDHVREVCPDLDYAGERVHWSIADPAAVPETETQAAFRQIAGELEERVALMLGGYGSRDRESLPPRPPAVAEAPAHVPIAARMSTTPAMRNPS